MSKEKILSFYAVSSITTDGNFEELLYSEQDVLMAMEIHAQSLLKEQREICTEAYLTSYESEDEADAIRNAPEPKV